MPATITDLIDGNSGRETIDGWELTRIAVVTDVKGDGYKKVILAAAELPAIGSAHPHVTECLLRERIPLSVAADTVKFRLVYSVPAPASFYPQLDTIEVGGTLSQVETNKDKDGNVIKVEYTYPSDYKLNTELAGKTIKTSGFISKLFPDHNITYSRLLLYNPSNLAKNFVGTVNSGPWLLDTLCTARQWLCTGIVGRSNDGGASYATTYNFQYRYDTWDGVAIFIDPYTGVPPEDLVDGTGIKSVQNYPVKEFNLIFS